MNTVPAESAATPRLHLILCLGADFDRAYIPHLCRHYARTVDSWNVVLHSRDLSPHGDQLITEARRLFESNLIDVASHATLATREWRGEFDPYTKVNRLNDMVRELVPRGEWVLYVDADELLDSPKDLKQLASRCELHEVVYGLMVDRFAPDKQPLAIDGDDDLFAKFPLSEEYTKSQMRAWVHKACLMRYSGEPLLQDCHDSTLQPWSVYRNSDRPVLKIWHFKWVATTREKLRHRVGSYRRLVLGLWADIDMILVDIFVDERPAGRNEARAEARPGGSEASHPYSNLEGRAFWKTAFDDEKTSAIWRPKWRLAPEDRVVTFGSCFARHLGPALKARGFAWLETEPPPRRLSRENASRYGYGHFSCRTGSLATPTALRQWVGWALGDEEPPDEVWPADADDRVIDPFRPSIEPGGFLSRDEMLASRNQAIESLRIAILKADVFLFTLGMTESWVHAPEGWVYPACPGTAGGRFDPSRHRFVNLSFAQAHEALLGALERLWEARPGLRVLLTVSPVPLIATASGDHVLTATTRSKAILRAVAGQVADSRPVVDYFPSYELVMTSMTGESMFAPNRRSVSARGVDLVMDTFFAAHGVQEPARPERQHAQSDSSGEDDPYCDDAWAEAFGP